MAIIEVDELDKLKGDIDLLNLQVCKQVLYGMAEILIYKSSIVSKIFMQIISEGVRYTKQKEGL